MPDCSIPTLQVSSGLVGDTVLYPCPESSDDAHWMLTTHPREVGGSM